MVVIVCTLICSWETKYLEWSDVVTLPEFALAFYGQTDQIFMLCLDGVPCGTETNAIYNIFYRQSSGNSRCSVLLDFSGLLSWMVRTQKQFLSTGDEVHVVWINDNHRNTYETCSDIASGDRYRNNICSMTFGSSIIFIVSLYHAHFLYIIYNCCVFIDTDGPGKFQWLSHVIKLIIWLASTFSTPIRLHTLSICFLNQSCLSVPCKCYEARANGVDTWSFLTGPLTGLPLYTLRREVPKSAAPKRIKRITLQTST